MLSNLHDKREFTTWTSHPPKLGEELREKGALFLIKEMVPRSQRKIVLGPKTGKKLFKRLTSQRDREMIYKFSKVNALRTGRSGA